MVAQMRARGEAIGLVPTMGALHEGHLALVRRSARENDRTVVSVFVNPRQFNQQEDFERYPRDLQADRQKLNSEACDLLYVPQPGDIYRGENDPCQRPPHDMGFPGQTLEAVQRPGHFQGVLDVVHRLFCQVAPNRAYFGLKDYQQWLIIRDFAAVHHPGLEIVPHPTVRETDGMALSSRNLLLSREARAHAVVIYQTLQWLRETAYGQMPLEEALSEARQSLAKAPGVDWLEYLEARRGDDLRPVSEWGGTQLVIGVALWMENVRLIDNVLVP